jgi:hypothetical protein
LSKWAPSIADKAHSPLELWRAVRDLSHLPTAIVSFPDQLFGFDQSYREIQIDGTKYLFSIIEMMIIMRFRPVTHMGIAIKSPWRMNRSTLSLSRFLGTPLSEPSGTEFDISLSQLMRHIVACRNGGISDWIARDVFSLKVGDNYKHLLLLKLQEIAALIRLAEIPSCEIEPIATLLDSIHTCRKRLLRRAA